MAAPSIRQLAGNSNSVPLLVPDPELALKLSGLAQTVLIQAEAVDQPEASAAVQHALNEPISPGTHMILHHLRDHHDSTSELLKHATIILRGAFSHVTGEPINGQYEEDLLLTAVNPFSIVEFIVPELFNSGMGPEHFGQETTDEPRLPLAGLLYGSLKSPMVTMIFEAKGRRVQLPVLVDTGGIHTCLNEESWKKLMPTMDTGNWDANKVMTVVVHGVDHGVRLGMGQTKGVNMVGKEWLHDAKALFVAGYKCNGCVILADNETHRARIPGLPNLADLTMH